MKTFVEYLDLTVSGKIYNPCGDRSKVILDGRRSLENLIQDAMDMNGVRRPTYPGFRIITGQKKRYEYLGPKIKNCEYSDLDENWD